MADKRKPGKARAWSAAVAVPIRASRNVSIEATRALAARCYLAGIRAARDCDETVIHSAVQRFHDAEQSRLGLAPTGKGKSGEGRK